MNVRTTLGLVIALVVAVFGVWWATSSETEDEAGHAGRTPTALVDPPLGELARFEIQIGSRPAAVFEMVEEKWRMTAPLKGPGEHFAVNADAQRIKDLKSVKAYGAGGPDRPDE
ncbi:MAG: hypothetical protein ACE5F9_12120 [Phycisphaerae bacterium]